MQKAVALQVAPARWARQTGRTAVTEAAEQVGSRQAFLGQSLDPVPGLQMMRGACSGSLMPDRTSFAPSVLEVGEARAAFRLDSSSCRPLEGIAPIPLYQSLAAGRNSS